MGQYHILVNLTKKEFVHPHQIGNGLKLHEQVGFDCSTATALVMLIAASSGRGGGDFSQHHLIGSWAGDKIAFIGDYAERSDIKGYNAKLIYDVCSWVKYGSDLGNVPAPYIKNRPRFIVAADGWKNISLQIQQMFADEFDVSFEGESDGWMNIIPLPKQKI